ncbi:MAG: permease [Desulfobacteraceae bacterium]|nr:permease [Desulfobacteraceae bacterium]MCF8095375.1 permease [Desulfobacteraceae bacterium]
MKKTVIIMSVVTILLVIIGIFRQGPEIILQGLMAGGKMLIEVVPLLMAAFVLAGMIQAVVSKETINKWLGKEAGIKGIMLGGVAGALLPGGPYLFYPIAASFLLSGAEIGTTLTFVVAKNLWSVSRLPLEVALLGPRVTIIRFIVTLIFPIIVGVLGNIFFSGYVDKVRDQIREIQGKGEKT